MDFLRPEIQDRLTAENHEFKTLLEAHKAADERLTYLRNKIRLSAKETVEEVELKKAKLRAKERIYKIVEEYKGRDQ